MSLDWWGLLVLTVHLIQGISAQEAKCTSADFAWANNAEGQDPCQLANALVTKCNLPPFAMLPAGTAMYGGPMEDNECLCNLVEYNLLRVCAKCQSATEYWVEDFPDWSRNCASHDVTTFPPGPPDGVSIPTWASAGSVAGPWTLEALKADDPPQAAVVSENTAASAETPQTLLKLADSPPQTTSTAEEEEDEEEPSSIPTLSGSLSATGVNTDEESPTTEQHKEVKTADQDQTTLSSPTGEAHPHPRPTVNPVAIEQKESTSTTSDNRSPAETTPSDAKAGQGDSNPPTFNPPEGHAITDQQRPHDGWAASPTRVVQTKPTGFRQGFGVHHAAGTKTPVATLPNAEAQSPPTLHQLSETSPSQTSAHSTFSEDITSASKSTQPTDLDPLSVSSSTTMATELLIAQETAAASGHNPEEGQNEEAPVLDENERPLSVNGSFAHSGDGTDRPGYDGKGSGRYQYEGDPGVTVTEESNKDRKTKIAAACVTVVALIVLIGVGFKIFMCCFRERRDEAEDRESWMEAKYEGGEEVELPTQTGILSRQSVWDRIQRSLMPKPARQIPSVQPLPYSRDEAGRTTNELGDLTETNQLSDQYPPERERQSFWSKCRKSFGPFGRPSFIPPVPAPNLAALRGLNVPKALRPGILKAQAPHNAGGAVNLNEQEVLEDEDIRFRQFNDSALVDSPYDAYTQEQERKWI